LSAILTKKENGRLSRTIVNRLWQKFMGRGLIEPVDDMEQSAWNADLLDWLAEDLVEHHYDLKQTIERILTSRAYQLPAVNLAELKGNDFVFRGPAVRRMSAEQFRDALGSLTGQWYATPAAPVDLEAGRVLAKPPKWIWTEPTASSNALETTLYLRKEIRLAEPPSEAYVVAACDSSYTLYLNGQKAASGKDVNKLEAVNIAKFLVKGKNTIAVQAVNGPAEAKDKAEKASKETKLNPAGFVLQARVRHSPKAGKGDRVMDFATDGSWIWSTNRFENWEKTNFMARGWSKVAELGAASMAPWNIGKKLAATIGSTAAYGHARASLVAADPLLVALGRPNREQVITVRSSVGTTLQMLELSNGQTLSKLLQKGAEQLLAGGPGATSGMVSRLYQSALGRGPTSQEAQLAGELIGKPARKEGLEDFLWAMAMLPEFQLIY
jgi:hypothetical protein